MTMSSWRIAGVLFALGGLLSAGGAALFASRGPGIGSWLTIAGVILEGAGFILLGIGFRRSLLPPWGPWLLVAVGALEFFFIPLSLIGVASRSELVAAGVLIAMVVGLAAAATAATRASRRALSNTLAVLAVCQLINDFSGAPVTLCLVGAVYVVLGIMLLRGARPTPRT
jgi:hypothetical protein